MAALRLPASRTTEVFVIAAATSGGVDWRPIWACALLAFSSLWATNCCGPNCMMMNLSTGALIGVVTAGAAWLATGRSHA